MLRNILAASAIVSLLGGCMAGEPAFARKRPPEGFAPALPLPPPPPVADGAIFRAGFGYAGLHEGTRARAIGDTLVIRLVERVQTSKSASAQTGKNGGFAVIPPTAGPLDFLDPNALKASGNSSFKGDGSANQASSLSGDVSVTIAEQVGNGTVRVRGQKLLTLSQGDEWVQFSGIVRLADIDADNVVPSNRVADARIEYAGTGAIQRASREGWLSRFFNLVSPF